jgi:hypothetical protein
VRNIAQVQGTYDGHHTVRKHEGAHEKSEQKIRICYVPYILLTSCRNLTVWLDADGQRSPSSTDWDAVAV